MLLHMPILSDSSPLFKLGSIAEFTLGVTIILLIINLIRKAIDKDQFFTGWTTFLIIVILISAGIFILCWQMPGIVTRGWMLIHPHIEE